MPEDWEIARVTGRCAVTARELSEGESYYAVLMRTPAGLERRDYSIESWSGPPEGTFCHWRGRMAVKQKKRGPISLDTQLLTHLFLQLEESDSESMQQLRFVIGLLLLRKRLVRMEPTLHQDGRELWQLRLIQDGSLHEVPNPQLASEQIERLSAQLLGLLSGELDAVSLIEGAPPANSEDAAPRPEDESAGHAPSDTERQENLATS